jgi:hypothetical protein
MNGLSESHNPYQAPNVEYVSEGRIAAISFRLLLLCGWISVLLVVGYSLFGMIANGYEMAVEFSDWRLREEVHLGFLFLFGAFLGLLMGIAHQRRSTTRILYVGVLALPGLAYVVGTLF